MKEKANQIAALLKILANPHRLLIMCALMESNKTVSRIAPYVPDISLSALSQHLTLLKTAGILHSEKHGQSVTYSIADERVEAVVRTLKKYYCEEKAELS